MLKASPHQLKRPKLPCFLRAKGKCYETQYVLGPLGSQVTWDDGDNVPLSSNTQLELVAKMWESEVHEYTIFGSMFIVCYNWDLGFIS